MTMSQTRPNDIHVEVLNPPRSVKPPRFPPFLTTAHTQLHPIGPEDMDFLYSMAISPQEGYRWRYRGRVPTPAAFQEQLWSGVLAQFVVRSRSDGSPMGLVVCYGYDSENGYAYFGAQFASEWVGKRAAFPPVMKCIQYLFQTWPLRKLYFDVPEFNLPAVSRHIGGLLKEEGVLQAHDYWNGRYWAKHILAIYPEDALASPID